MAYSQISINKSHVNGINYEKIMKEAADHVLYFARLNPYHYMHTYGT